jgi:adenylate cyclase
MDPAHRQRAMPVVFAICILGGFAGIAVAIFTGRAIMEPLQKVRGALRSVEQGDFGVALPVTDSAELGDLEVGFNRMALGLRDRERMREVFGRLVGDEVAKQALDGQLGLGGERRTTTVMFVDIIGSTRLAQTRAPEEVVSILNAFFDAVVRSVSAEGGFINKFEGDGALCIFGAPTHLDDHAARALRAAKALRTELISLPDIDGIEAAIGISSGEVVAGNIGAADRYEYTVIGDPVNEAARLTEQAKTSPARILVSESTIRRAAIDAHAWLPAGTMQLRGRAEATLAYEPA